MIIHSHVKQVRETEDDLKVSLEGVCSLVCIGRLSSRLSLPVRSRIPRESLLLAFLGWRQSVVKWLIAQENDIKVRDVQRACIL